MTKITIVIPVYNEKVYLSELLRQLLDHIKKVPEIFKIILVNDGSTDDTKNIILKMQKKHKIIILIDSKINNGKGYSMRMGFKKALENKIDGVIFMDGDGQHHPSSLKKIVHELKYYSLVLSYRHLKKKAPFIRKLGNRISSFIIRNIFNIKRKGDILCGYFAMRKDIFGEIEWYSNDYGVEAEISAIVGRKKIQFKEILVKTIYLDNKKGVNLFHALRILMRIPFWNIVHSYK